MIANTFCGGELGGGTVRHSLIKIEDALNTSPIRIYNSKKKIG